MRPPLFRWATILVATTAPSTSLAPIGVRVQVGHGGGALRTFLRGRWAPAAAGATVMLFVGGGAFAIAAGSGGWISACVHHKGGGLYLGQCAKHDKKLFWNVTGPAGRPGTTGASGPQGPGSVTFTFNGTASTTPTRQTVGTILGETISADCFLTSTGNTQLRIYLQTGDGSWTVDYAYELNDNATTSSYASSLSLAPGTLSSPFVVDSVQTGAAPSLIDKQLSIMQLGPQKATMVWHETAQATTTPSQTCHLAVQAFPTA